MTQSELNREVASITGESIATISRLLLVGKSRPFAKSNPVPASKNLWNRLPISNPKVSLTAISSRHFSASAAALRP